MTKKMTKQVWLYALIALFVCAAIVGVAVAFTSTASADEVQITDQGSGTGTGNVTVKYEVKGEWEVTISADSMVLVPGSDQTITVTVDKAILADGESLKVTVNGANMGSGKYRLKHQSRELYLEYSLKEDARDLGENSEIISVSGGATDTATLTANLSTAEAEKAVYSGSYTDTLTFTVSKEAA